MQKDDKQFTIKAGLIFLLLTIIIGMSALVINDYQTSRQNTMEIHSTLIEKEHWGKKKEIENVFQKLYQALRTMSLIPAIRSIDKYGKNLSHDAHTTIQQIYNNVAEDMGLSEIYAVDIDMDPDRIDPNTQKKMIPIFTYDKLIIGKRGNIEEKSQKPESVLEEVEIHEYREMRSAASYFKKNYPSMSFRGLRVPGIISKEVITCDNSELSRSDLIAHDNSKRNGLVYSVPFYSKDGVIKGIMSGIIRSEVLKRYLGTHTMGLVNITTGYHITFGISQDIFNYFDESGHKKGTPEALYIETLSLDIADKNKWKLVCYIPMSELSSQFKEIKTQLIIRVIFLIMMLVAGLSFIFSVYRQKDDFAELVKDLSAVVEGKVSGNIKDQVKSLVDKYGNVAENSEEVPPEEETDSPTRPQK